MEYVELIKQVLFLSFGYYIWTCLEWTYFYSQWPALKEQKGTT